VPKTLRDHMIVSAQRIGVHRFHAVSRSVAENLPALQMPHEHYGGIQDAVNWDPGMEATGAHRCQFGMQ
jgi:hypothetical protein